MAVRYKRKTYEEWKGFFCK